MSDEKQEQFKISGKDVVDRVKKLIEEGNCRRIIVQKENGEQIIEIPLTFGVVGAVLLPVLATLAAATALLTHCTIVVERK